ncbi:MAG: PTS sugar transporter subunit IIA [Alphaproteobacteria bacterium]
MGQREGEVEGEKNLMQDIVAKNHVICDLAAANKKALLQDMAARAGEVTGLSPHVIFDALWEREKLGTTGVGHGIAIPHGKIAGLEGVCGFFARLAAPIDFEAVDDKPVDLVFLLLAPSDAGADHLQALAQASKMLRDPQFCAQCRKARDAAAIFNMMIGAEAAAA